MREQAGGELAGRILVVDDDQEMRRLLKDVLEDRGHQVDTAPGGKEALALLAGHDYAVVLTDLKMKGMEGLELLGEIRRDYPASNVILMTAFGTIESAIEAMKQGAYDYLTKPVKTEEMVLVVEKALREAALRREVSRLRQEVHREYSFHQILGKSKPMREVFDLIRRVADSSTNVLITGESGTGKELVAKAIHYNSARRDASFVPVNCAAIPEALLESELFGHMKGSFTDAKTDKRGLFEEAQKGTLFLDEISELPLMLQAKILRAIQEREIRRVGATKSVPVDVRIIAATNLHLTDEVKAKRFREDLYYRLNVIEIHLPPLRERREDIPLLVDAFFKKCLGSSQKPLKGISEAALAVLVDYAWPGNVREDLYYRVHVIHLRVPPLRERREDVLCLAQRFLREYLQAHPGEPRYLHPLTERALAAYAWPGNVRELENVVERAVTLCRGEKIVPDDLPPAIQGSRGDRKVLDEAAERTLPLEDVEKEYILRILEKTGGNKYQAAQLLGIDRKTLYRKLGEIEERTKGE